MGIFGNFIQVQDRMNLGNPWLFPYGVTVGVLTVVFIIILAVLSNRNALTPGICIIFSFVLFVLFLTGLIETGVQLFGSGGVSANCQKYVNNANTQGPNVQTLAWLEQNGICSSWYAVFSFWIVGTIVFLAMMVMSFQVMSGNFD